MTSRQCASRRRAALLLFGAVLQLPAQATGPTGTLVVANMNDNTAMVIDAASGRLFATLPTGEGPHEVAVSHDGRWALVSNYGVRGKPGNSITVIDVEKASVNRTIVLQDYQRPHGMVFLPGDTMVAVTCEVRGMLLLVNLRRGTVARTLETGGRAPHIVAMTDKGDRFVTGNIGSATLAIVDPSGRDSATLVKVGRQPEGVTIAPDGSSAWAGSNVDSVVMVIDPARGIVTDTLRGFGLPYRMKVTPDSRTAVVTDPVKAQVRIFDARTRKEKFVVSIPADSLVATAEIKGSASPEGLAVSADSRWAFVTLQGRNRIAVIDLGRGAIVNYFTIGNWSDGIGYSRLVLKSPS